MYIEIKIEIACDQNKLNFSRALIGLAKKTFFDCNWFSTNSSLLAIFEITRNTRECLN